MPSSDSGELLDTGDVLATPVERVPTLDTIQSPVQGDFEFPVFLSPGRESEYVPGSPGSSDNESPIAVLRRSSRNRSQPAWMSDYVDGEALLSHSGSSLKAAVPSSIKAALLDPMWKDAMTKEFDSLMENKVWSLERLPKGRTSIGGKWHLCLKYGSSGEVLRYKARYVAKGYSQVHGRDYDETYSPTVKLSAVRCMLAYAAQLGQEERRCGESPIFQRVLSRIGIS